MDSVGNHLLQVIDGDSVLPDLVERLSARAVAYHDPRIRRVRPRHSAGMEDIVSRFVEYPELLERIQQFRGVALIRAHLNEPLHVIHCGIYARAAHDNSSRFRRNVPVAADRLDQPALDQPKGIGEASERPPIIAHLRAAQLLDCSLEMLLSH